MEPWVWWEGAFTDQELDWLQQKAMQSNEQGQVGGAPTKEKLLEVRRSQVSWLRKTQENAWVFERLAHIAASLNSEYYKFDLTGFGEPFQLTNYDQADQGMYSWHVDFGGHRRISRKLSLVVQLTDPSEYEGGNLQVMVGPKIQTVRKQRGFVVAFPSYILHQVTPVTQGTRQSLVAWASGPQFK